METVSSLSTVVRRKGVRISLVIPAHNEAKSLPYVLQLIPGCVNEVILADDHSMDGTVEIARRSLPMIRVVYTQQKRGKGAALRKGFAAATGDIIVMMDADGSNDPREIPALIEALLAGAYLVIGSRFAPDGGSEDMTPVQRLGYRVLISMANRLFRMQLTDTLYGFNAFWKDCLDYFELDCDGFEAEALIVLRVRKANLAIVEVPSYEHALMHGGRHIRTFQGSWRLLKMMLREWLKGQSVTRTMRMRNLDQEYLSLNTETMLDQISRLQ
jgi:glycosyltransferase involved in cell wall biosynthesis